MPEPTPDQNLFFSAPWKDRLAFAIETMREISLQTDPQSLVQTYSRRIRQVLHNDGFIALSRRGLESPRFRITRSSTWAKVVNPWRSKSELPMLEGGLLAEMIYGDEPVVIDDLKIAPGDPGAPYFEGMRSVQAIPLFDQGLSLNMVVQMRKEPGAFSMERLPEQVWMSNLFGRATNSLVLSDEVKRAYDTVERELKVVADIQRSLLPTELPDIPTLELAAHYQTSQRAGGDYYDFFPLADGRWGILIADVSGHGTPAAVLMAVTHSIAHTHHEDPEPPSKLMAFINRHLCARYTNNGTFVTAFYGIYDPADCTLIYSRAGHCPPRVMRCGGPIRSLDESLSLPLGIDPDEPFCDGVARLERGDVLVFYTDGITEARSPNGDLFAVERLDEVLSKCAPDCETMIRHTLIAVEDFTEDAPPVDDMTLLVAKVR